MRPRALSRILTAVVLVSLCVDWGTGTAAAPQGNEASHPNIVVVTIDTLRADHLGVYGYNLNTDPQLRRLAAEGVVFEDAMTVAPLTLPSHLSLLTGTYPLAHGVHDNDQPWRGGASLAELLGAQGYQTAAFVSTFVLSSRFGLSRGFQVYDDHFEAAGSDSVTIERPGAVTVDQSLSWLRTVDAAKPFFLWVHLFEPHRPYHPPAPFDTLFSSPYDGEIAAADAALGTLLGTLRGSGSWKNTVVLVAGDHGEGLGEHEESTHGFFVYQSTLRVPLIVKLPGNRSAGTRVRRPVSLVDVAPTLARLAGLSPASSMQGRRLGELCGAVPSREESPRGLYAESYTFPLHFGWAGQLVYRRGDLKLIDTAIPELYNLAEDPGERNNLFPQRRALGTALQSQLEDLARQYTAPSSPAKNTEPDPETLEKLRSLGYSGLSLPNSTVLDRKLPDAKTKLDILKSLKRAEELLQTRPDRAIPELKRIARLEPRLLRARELLGVALSDAGRWRELTEELLSLEKLTPDSYKAPAQLSLAYEKLGQLELADAAIKRALALDPANPYLHFNRGHLLETQGRVDLAEESYREAIRLQPSYSEAHYNLAQILFRRRKPEEALTHYSAALKADPGWREALNNSGLCLALTGRLEEAVQAWRKALALDPGYQAARSNLIQALVDLGRNDEAEREKALLSKSGDRPRR